MCYFTCQAQKLPFLAVLTCFPILGKIQGGGQDGDHCLWHRRPPAGPPPIKYTSSCWDYQRLSTEGKIVSEYCNIPKTLGRGSMNPALLYHGGGTNLRSDVQGLRAFLFLLHPNLFLQDFRDIFSPCGIPTVFFFGQANSAINCCV